MISVALEGAADAISWSVWALTVMANMAHTAVMKTLAFMVELLSCFLVFVFKMVVFTDNIVLPN